MTAAPGAVPLDLPLALRQIALGFWHDFAPIVLLGFVMVTLPEVALALAGTHGGSTVIATFGGMLRVLYVVIVSHGTLARLDDRPLGPRIFARAGVAASPRALSVALLLGAGVVLVLVALLLAGLAGGAAIVVRVAVIAVAFAVAVVAVPAIPLALVERRAPVATLTRAAALTAGNRGRIAIVIGVVVLTIVPARLVIAASVYGLAASAARMGAIDAGMTLASPGLWLIALFDLLGWSVGAVVPAVIYRGLRN